MPSERFLGLGEEVRLSPGCETTSSQLRGGAEPGAPDEQGLPQGAPHTLPETLRARSTGWPLRGVTGPALGRWLDLTFVMDLLLSKHPGSRNTTWELVKTADSWVINKENLRPCHHWEEPKEMVPGALLDGQCMLGGN